MDKTNLQLIELMGRYNLSYKGLAKILKSSETYVRGYTCNAESKRYRRLPEIKLVYLKARLGQLKRAMTKRTEKS